MRRGITFFGVGAVLFLSLSVSVMGGWKIDPFALLMTQEVKEFEKTKQAGAPNRSPIAGPLGVHTAKAGGVVRIIPIGFDSDGTIDHISIVQIEGPLVNLNKVFDEKGVHAQYLRKKYPNMKSSEYSFIMPVLSDGETIKFETNVTDNEGATSSNIVSYSRIKELSVVTNTEKGIPPLNINFRLETHAKNPIVYYAMDYDGDDKVDTFTNESDEFEFTYETVGKFRPKAIIRDTQGNQYEHSFDIEVLSVEGLSESIELSWNAMASQFLNGNIEQGIRYVAGELSQDDHRLRFSKMDEASIRARFSSVSNIQVNSVAWPYVFCLVIAPTTEGLYGRPVIALNNGKRGWKFDNF